VKKGVLLDTEAKRARAAAGLRTSATHARWDQFGKGDVEACIHFTRDFVVRRSEPSSETMSDIHSARAYFVQAVLPQYEGFLQVLEDGRHGLRRDVHALGRAAETCLHLVDHLCRDPTCNASIAGAPKSKKYVEELTDKFRAFAIVRDIANAWKHGVCSREGKTIEGIKSLDDRWTVMRAADDLGDYYAGTKCVLVHLVDGIAVFADQVLLACVLDLATELVRLGVIDRALALRRRTWPSRPAGRPHLSMVFEGGEFTANQPALLVVDPSTGSSRFATFEDDFDLVVDLQWSVLPSTLTGARAAQETGTASISIKPSKSA
jgi:hypothetical protein